MSTTFEQICERYRNKEFPACTTLETIVKDSRSGYKVEAVCKVCGQKAWFRTETIKTAKSCGCRNHRNQRPQGGSMLEVFENLKGETHGNLTFLGEASREGGYWHIRCQCTICGSIVWRRYDFWSKRTAVRCTCDQNKSINAIDRRLCKGRWDIEHLWPKIVQAGREAVGTYA